MTAIENLKSMLCMELNDKNLFNFDFDLDMNNNFETLKKAATIKSYMHTLVLNLESDMRKSIEILKESVNHVGQRVDVKVAEMKEEIDARIESIKNELDRVNKQFHSELDNIKLDILSMKALNNRDVREDIDYYDRRLEKLNDEIKKGVIQSSELLKEYQNDQYCLNQLLKKIDDFDFELLINVSEDMAINLIGSLNYVLKYRSKNKNFISNEQIKQNLKNNEFKMIDTNVEVIDLCVLSNGTLLTSNYRTLSIFNERFELVKTINAIENRAFCASGLTTDNDKRIYISDHLTDHVIMCDLNLNRIKSVTCNILANQVNSVETPCYYSKQLYVPYRLNKQIKKFSADLVFDKTIALDYQPAQIKIANNVACVKPDEKKMLYFYDLDSFQLIRVFQSGLGRISQFNSYFYEFNFHEQKLVCYNQKAELKDTFDFRRICCYEDDGEPNYDDLKWNANAVCFNGHLIVSTNKAKKFIKI